MTEKVQDKLDPRRLERILFRAVPALSSDFFGVPARRISPAQRKAFRRRMRPFLREMIRVAAEADASPTPQVLQRVFDLLGGLLLEPMRGTRRRQTDGLGLVEQLLRALLKAPVHHDLPRTGYRRYQGAIRRLVAQLPPPALVKAHAAWGEMSQHEGPALVQRTMREGMTPSLAAVLRGRRVPRMADAEPLIRRYRTLAGLYEKLACLAVAFAEIRDNREASYRQIRRASLAATMKRLAADPQLKVFADAFDRTLRNAIAHDTYQLLPASGRIRFTDHSKPEALSPRALRGKVREAEACVVALCQLPLFLYGEAFRVWRRVWGSRRRSAQGMPRGERVCLIESPRA